LYKRKRGRRKRNRADDHLLISLCGGPLGKERGENKRGRGRRKLERKGGGFPTPPFSSTLYKLSRQSLSNQKRKEEVKDEKEKGSRSPVRSFSLVMRCERRRVEEGLGGKEKEHALPFSFWTPRVAQKGKGKRAPK